MDDKYFSHRNTDNQPDGREKYTKADYFDENFSLKFKKGQGNAQSFSKSGVDDDESFSSFARNMEPDDIDGLFSDGQPRKPVSRTTSAAPQRAVQKRNQPGDNVRHTPSHGVYNTLPGDPSRVPTGRVVTGKKKREKKSRVLRAVIAVLLVLIIAAGGFVFYLFNRIDNMLDKVDHDDTIINDRFLSSDAPVSDEVINVLLIGSDERSDGSVKGQRSDTMILLSIDSANKQIKLTSFLRDSYVEIPYTDSEGNKKIIKSKMNAAYSKAGAQGVIDTIEYNFGINVHNYVSVNFEAFEKIIDLMGGVTVDGVTEKEAKYMNREADTEIKAGSNHMDGYEALWYCRIRKLDSDFYRTQRQRKVISAVIDKAKSMNVTELMKIIDNAMPYITTSMSKNEIKTLGKDVLSYIGYETVQQQVPADGTWRDGSVNGSYVIDFDIQKNKELLQDFVYNKVEQTKE